MFIGGLILAIAGFQIISATSLPVINGIFNTKASFEDETRNQFYNYWQSLFGIFILLIMGVAQYLRYTKDNFRRFLKQSAISFLIALSLTI